MTLREALERSPELLTHSRFAVSIMAPEDESALRVLISLVWAQNSEAVDLQSVDGKLN
ncbi:MAG: hypothetical protein WD623_07075 [Marinobacter sp.]|uniref:hypothetical protein n=1 Tax=Marinobacter sp. TaxID=50741 RepID=UPI0034A07853